jgi:hypothetical protein
MVDNDAGRKLGQTRRRSQRPPCWRKDVISLLAASGIVFVTNNIEIDGHEPRSGGLVFFVFRHVKGIETGRW